MENTNGEMGKLSVAVVGGGIGGLAAAIALQRSGVDCTVYERDESFKQRREGFGLTLTNNPKGPLAALGLLEECIDADCPSTCHWVFGPTGKILGYYGRYFKDRPFDEAKCAEVSQDERGSLKIRDRGNLRVPRQDLREMLLRQLRPGSVRWGSKLTRLIDDPCDEHVVLQFEGRVDERAHVVVGADGIHSQVRRLRDAAAGGPVPGPVPADTLSYLGVAVIIGISPVTSPLLQHQGFYVVDGTHRLFTMPFRSSACARSPSEVELTMWQLSFSGLGEEEALSLRSKKPEELLREASRRTQSWFGAVKEMIASSLLSDIWATPLFDRPPPVLHPRHRECGSRLTVLGDACHPMSMFKGQGANQALQDGVLLAKWLGGEATSEAPSGDGESGLGRQPSKRRRLAPATPSLQVITTRLRCFEREMVDRAAPKVSASRSAAADYHSPAALELEYGIEGLPGAAAVLSTIGATDAISAESAVTAGRHGLEELVLTAYRSRRGAGLDPENSEGHSLKVS